MQHLPILTTARLTLRAFQSGDEPRLVELLRDQIIADFIPGLPYPYTLQDATDWVRISRKLTHEDTQYPFAITLDGELIGATGLRYEGDNYRGEVGYWMGQAYWGKGYVTEAVQRLIQFAFEDIGVNRVFAICFTDNARSENVMQRVGMTHEGILRQHLYHPRLHVFKDVHMYSLIRNEYGSGMNG